MIITNWEVSTVCGLIAALNIVQIGTVTDAILIKPL